MIHVLSQRAFDKEMRELDLDDSNVDSETNSLFISIIGAKESLDSYLHESETKHYFNDDHHNVINLDFDDVDEDTKYNGIEFKSISSEQCEMLVEFISRNVKRDGNVDIYIHCRAGISRSRAVAEYIARHYQIGYDDKERKLFYNYLNHGVLRKLERAYRDNLA